MGAKIPAAIRYKNPSAMWPNKLATKWGSTEWVYLNDKTGQGGGGKGNRCAIFKTYVQGICAQLDLWRTSPNYRNRRFADAIDIWCGHNNTRSYINHVKARIPGMTEDTVMNDAFWRSPNGVKFLAVQAAHEAGQQFPVLDKDWQEAQRIVMSGKVPMTPATKATTGAAVGSGTVTTTAAATAVQSGWPWWAVFVVILLGVGLAVGAAWFFGRQKEVEADLDVEPPLAVRGTEKVIVTDQRAGMMR